MTSVRAPVVTYAYTDATGLYTVSITYQQVLIIFILKISIIRPLHRQHILSPTSVATVSGVDFIQHTGSKTITPTTESVANITTQNTISIYPNPTNGILNIQWSNSVNTTAHFTITDVTSKKAFDGDMTIAAGKSLVNIGQLVDGVYILSIHAGNKHYEQKITIVH